MKATAQEKLVALTYLIKISDTHRVNFGFNEWIKAQNGNLLARTGKNGHQITIKVLIERLLNLTPLFPASVHYYILQNINNCT